MVRSINGRCVIPLDQSVGELARCLVYCTAFRGPFDARDAAILVHPADETHVAAMLESLADDGKLSRIDGKYQIPTEARATARKQLTSIHDRRLVAERFVECMRGHAKRILGEYSESGLTHATAAIAERHEDLLAALEWTMRGGDARLPALLDLVWALRFRWADGGRTGEGLVWTQRVLATVDRFPNVSAETLAHLWYLRMRICYAAADYQTLIDRAPYLISVFTQSGDREALGRAYNLLSLSSWCSNQPDAAEQYGQLSLALHRSVGNQRGVAVALCNLGCIAIEARGDIPGAIGYFERALEIADTGKMERVRAATLVDLAEAHFRQSEHDRAHELLAQAFDEAKSIENAPLQAASLQLGARVRMAQSDFDGATADLALAMQLLTADPSPEVIAVTVEGIAQFAARVGRFSDAVTLYRAAEQYRKANALRLFGWFTVEAGTSLEQARRLLPPDVWETAQIAGERLPVADLPAYAQAVLSTMVGAQPSDELI
jgi:tetratricopeptide (TPR) repeat protein